MNKNNNLTIITSKNKKINPLVIVLFALMLIYSLTIIFTLCFGFITSLKGYSFHWSPDYLGLPNIEADKLEASLSGESYSLFKNYSYVFSTFNRWTEGTTYYSLLDKVEIFEKQMNLGTYFLNTVIYAGICPLLTVIVSSVSGFLCCKYKYKYSSFLCAMLLITMTIPTVGTQASTITLLQQLGIYDTYFSMIIMNMHFGGLYFFVFYGFFQGMSDSFIEAAEIDGASQFKTLTNIVLPLASKTMLTVFIILFVRLWNDYEVPLIYYPDLPTLAYGIWQISGGNTMNTGMPFEEFWGQAAPLRMAGNMALCIPTLVLFICFRNVLMGNLTLGGVKE